jgi:hypothetical protein
MKKFILTLFVIVFPLSLQATTFGKWQGYAERGGSQVSVSGFLSSTKVQQSFPGATETVYLTGTTTIATIYSDAGVTLKSNPFTVDSTGFGYFYIDNSISFDIKFSGTGISVPFTLSNITLSNGVLPAVPSIIDYGAINDGRTLTGTVNSGIATLNLTSGSFTSADIGRSFTVLGGAGVGVGLTGTILSIGSSTSATISSTPSASVSNAMTYIATDSTSAIQTALDNSKAVTIPAGAFGFTRLRLHYGQSINGAGIGSSTLLRIGLGAGGPAISMVGGSDIAQELKLSNFSVRCGQIGTGLDGINLGYEVAGGGFAFGSIIENVKVWSASGFAFNLASNAGIVRNIWAENQNSGSQSTAGGFKVTVTNLYADILGVEGFYPAGPYILNASGSSTYKNIQSQLQGTYATTDVVSIGVTGTVIDGLYLFGGGTYRDVVRILGGQQFTELRRLNVDPTHPAYTNLVNDIPNGRTYTSAVAHLSRYVQAADGSPDTAAYPVFADNASALAAGYISGGIYRTSTGELRIVVP